MFKKFFSSSKESSLRDLNNPADLKVGDVVKFKPRSSLPAELQGESFEVTKVGCYQYDSGVSPEFTLWGVNDRVITLSIEDDNGTPALSLSVPVPRSQVLALFDEDNFAQLWGPGYATLQTRQVPESLQGWVSQGYHQEVSDGEGYYYQRDLRGETLSSYQDDCSEEFRYHECTGDDDRYGLSVEVWSDGSTDVYAQVYCPIDVIEEMWPHNGES